MQIKFILLLFFSSFLMQLQAQSGYQNWVALHQLEYVNNLPQYIKQTKSIGLVVANTREEGMELANMFHPTFVKAGIDPVSYYHVDDLFANNFISEELAAEFEKREVKYMLILSKDDSGVELVITAFSGADNFIEKGRKAWRMKNKEYQAITRALYAQAYALERENFLIVERPEFQSLNAKIKGQRYEAYKPDLRAETLYIPLQKHIELDSTAEYKTEYMELIKRYNQGIDEQNQELKSLFANYLYQHSFIEEGQDERELMKNNVRFVLQRIHAVNKDVRSVLKYTEKTDGVTEYVTVTMNNGQGDIKRISAEVPVYKYYIKHLPSESYYLGTRWDADITWQEALQNHIGLLAVEIGN